MDLIPFPDDSSTWPPSPTHIHQVTQRRMYSPRNANAPTRKRKGTSLKNLSKLDAGVLLSYLTEAAVKSGRSG